MCTQDQRQNEYLKEKNGNVDDYHLINDSLNNFGIANLNRNVLWSRRGQEQDKVDQM